MGWTLLTEVVLVTPRSGGVGGSSRAVPPGPPRGASGLVSSLEPATAAHICLAIHSILGQRRHTKRAAICVGECCNIVGGGGHHNTGMRMARRTE
jgi:hypothetical protein